MNVRISHTYTFNAVQKYLDEPPIANTYTVTVYLMTATDDSYQQNVAFDRMNFMFEEVFKDAVFIEESDVAKEHFKLAGFNVIEFPTYPYDQIIGFAIFSKLTAIMEQRMFVTDIETSSVAGKNVKYLLAAEENLGPLDFSGWWSDTSMMTSTLDGVCKTTGNVVKMPNKTQTWDDIGLGWDSDFTDDSAYDSVISTDDESGNIVVVKFDPTRK